MCGDISQLYYSDRNEKRLNFQNCCWQIEIDQIQNPTHVCHIFEAFWDWSAVIVNTLQNIYNLQVIWIYLTSISLGKPDDLAQSWTELYWSPKMQWKIFFFSLFYSLSCKKILMIFKKKKIQQMLSYIFRWDLKKLSTLIFQSKISKKQLWIGVWWCQFNPTTNLGSFLLGHQKWLRCWFLSILGKKIGLYFVFLARHFSLGL